MRKWQHRATERRARVCYAGTTSLPLFLSTHRIQLWCICGLCRSSRRNCHRQIVRLFPPPRPRDVVGRKSLTCDVIDDGDAHFALPAYCSVSQYLCIILVYRCRGNKSEN